MIVIMTKEGKTRLENRIKELEEIVESHQRFSLMLDEDIPKKDGVRKEYMAKISGIYDPIFREKLKHFMGLQYRDLGLLLGSDKYYQILRSNISCLTLIDEWMKKCHKEHLADLIQARDAVDNIKNDDNADFINNMREEYNL